MNILTDHLLDHTKAVDTVAAVAASPPEWTALRERLTNYLNTGTPMQDKLIAAIIDHRADVDVDELRALALAEQAGIEQVGTLNARVRHQVLRQLRAIYSTHAVDNYRAVADKFNTAAKEFVTAATIIDPDADAAEVTKASDKARRAWWTAESAANNLTTLMEPLAAAAALAGIPDTSRKPVQLALCCDPGDHHRREVWTAWETKDGRTTRWGALHRLGVTLRAHPADALDSFTAYREPAALEQRHEQIARGQWRTLTVDPEDPDYRPPTTTKPTRGRMVAP